MRSGFRTGILSVYTCFVALSDRNTNLEYQSQPDLPLDLYQSLKNTNRNRSSKYQS